MASYTTYLNYFQCKNIIIITVENLEFQNSSDAYSPDTPEGFVIKKLEKKHAEFVSSYWSYFVDNKVLYFKHLIINFRLFCQNNPTSPIAWCLQYPFGQPGHLFVLEKYCQKGFAVLLYLHICKSIQDEGFVPAVSVDVHNHAAESLSWRC